MDKWVVGVDIGGTTTKIGFFEQNGILIAKIKLRTNVKENGLHIVNDIYYSITRKLKDYGFDIKKLKGIGVGAPGFIDYENGTVLRAINLGWDNYPIKQQLENLTGLPIIVENDANVAALGEHWMGAGINIRDLIVITIGTGIGGGVITNGEIVRGDASMAGEIGHITVQIKDGERCNCGKNGCLETIASATGIVRNAMKNVAKYDKKSLLSIPYESGKMSAKDVFDAAKKNDELANMIVNEVGFYLGLAIANICHAINPRAVILGGGVAQAGNILVQPVEKHFQMFALQRVYERTELHVAKLGNDAGIFGAASLFIHQ